MSLFLFIVLQLCIKLTVLDIKLWDFFFQQWYLFLKLLPSLSLTDSNLNLFLIELSFILLPNFEYLILEINNLLFQFPINSPKLGLPLRRYLHSSSPTNNSFTFFSLLFLSIFVLNTWQLFLQWCDSVFQILILELQLLFLPEYITSIFQSFLISFNSLFLINLCKWLTSLISIRVNFHQLFFELSVGRYHPRNLFQSFLVLVLPVWRG